MKRTGKLLSLLLALALALALLPTAAFADGPLGDVNSMYRTTDTGTLMIDVGWSAALNATHYVLERSTDGENWTVLSDRILPDQTDTYGNPHFEDYTVEYGVSYTYRVTPWQNNVHGAAYWDEMYDDVFLYAPGPIAEVTATVVSQNRIDVTWTGSPHAMAYRVQRQQKGAGGTWTTIATVGDILTVSDYNVSPATTYRYRVQGRNPKADGAYQTSNEVTTQAPKPGAIASVTCTAASDGITVKWAAADNAATYLIQRREKGEEWSSWTTIKANASGTSYKDATVTPKALYQYRVRGRNEVGNGPLKSGSSIRAAALPKPGAIASVTATPATGKVTVAWKASANAATYLLQRQVYGETAWTNVKSGLKVLNYTDTAVKAGTKYRYRVRGVNASGSGAFKVSSYAQVPAAAKPGAIASVTAAAVTGRINVSWRASANASQYVLQRRAQTNGAWGSWSNISTTLTGLSYADTAVTAGTLYQYRVRGRAGSAYGAYKVSSSVKAVGKTQPVGGDSLSFVSITPAKPGRGKTVTLTAVVEYTLKSASEATIDFCLNNNDEYENRHYSRAEKTVKKGSGKVTFTVTQKMASNWDTKASVHMVIGDHDVLAHDMKTLA